MNQHAITLDFGTIQRSTRRSIFASLVAHIVLFMLLVFSYRAASETAGLTEVTWIDDAAPVQTADAAPPVAREQTAAPLQETKSSVAREAEQTENFARPLERAAVELLEQGQLVPLQGIRRFHPADVRDGRVAGPEDRRLVARREEAAVEVVEPARGNQPTIEHDEGRQVAALRPQPIPDPGPHARAAL